jgi:hypothetical protein
MGIGGGFLTKMPGNSPLHRIGRSDTGIGCRRERFHRVVVSTTSDLPV